MEELLFGLVGYPLAHSFSPKIFSELFSHYKINASYQLFPLEFIQQLPDLLIKKPELKGLNVTIPYKKEIIPFLNDYNNVVVQTQSVNTLVIHETRILGFNTDVIGFEKAIAPLLKPRHNQALILGNGGSAASVKFVLRKLGIEYKIVSRVKTAETITYSELNESDVSNSKLLINTTPLGMHPQIDTFPDILYQYIGPEHLLFDLIYNPDETLFLQKGKANGATICNGLTMLQYQAEAALKIWINHLNDKI